MSKAAPQFTVPQVLAFDKTFSPQEMKGKVWMLNVFASWCVSCKLEHPLLIELQRAQVAPVVGLDYKDTRRAVLSFLAQNGDPYGLVAFDGDGRVGIDYGVYGVPETYVIDKRGTIRFKQIGPISSELLQGRILPLIRELQQ